jgi:hypothetical protein
MLGKERSLKNLSSLSGPVRFDAVSKVVRNARIPMLWSPLAILHLSRCLQPCAQTAGTLINVLCKNALLIEQDKDVG